MIVVVVLPRNSTRNMALSTDTCHVASGWYDNSYSVYAL